MLGYSRNVNTKLTLRCEVHHELNAVLTLGVVHESICNELECRNFLVSVECCRSRNTNAGNQEANWTGTVGSCLEGLECVVVCAGGLRGDTTEEHQRARELCESTSLNLALVENTTVINCVGVGCTKLVAVPSNCFGQVYGASCLNVGNARLCNELVLGTGQVGNRNPPNLNLTV